MEALHQKSNLLLSRISLNFQRKLIQSIIWEGRLIGITGARGVGKTTLLLQVLKQKYAFSATAIYLSADDLYFTEHKLYTTIKQFHIKGGKTVFIDEVHKYPNWSRELKNLYDTYPKLSIIFSGSSSIDILKEQVDLSRRAMIYELNGFSFKEYLSFAEITQLNSFSLTDILENHVSIAAEISQKIQPLSHFSDYLRFGYYPFFKENPQTFYYRLEQIIRLITEVDLQFIDGFNPHYSRKLQQLLLILSESVPFKPNVSKLSERMGIHRNTLTQYLHYMAQAKLLNLLMSDSHGISLLQKPEKLYLENTNIMYALLGNRANSGTIRETFMMTSLKNHTKNVLLPKNGDFLINDSFLIEVGGKNKTTKQIQEFPNAFLAVDDIEIGAINKIPLWLFGFLE